jgi:Spy/CpxP family protein refolding chaperone
MSARSVITRVRVQGLAVLAAVFVSGVLLGAAVERLRAPVVVAPTPAATGPLVPTQDVIMSMKMARSGVPVVYEALGLTNSQRERIQAIMEANRPRTDSLLHATWPAVRALLDTVQRQVERVLTAEQRLRLETMRRGVAGPSAPATSPDRRNRP